VKAIIQIYKTGELKVVETPPPQLRPGWVLVRNSHSLISAGTEKTKVDTARMSLLGKAMARPDLVKKVIDKARREGLWKAWQTASDRLEQLTPLGYSCAGQVMAVRGDVDGLCEGDRVACGGSGANHAEIVCVPKNLVVPIPEGVNSDAAAFTTLGAIALQGVRQADVRLGEIVAVVGLGLLGLLSVQLLRASGCRVLGTDVDPAKLALAKELGCEVALLASDESLQEQVLISTGGYGVDATIITASTSSNQPVEQAGEITRERGRVVVVGGTGLTIPREPYYRKEIDFRISRSYGPGRYDPRYEEDGHDYPYGYVRFTERRNMACFLDLLGGGQVQVTKMITHRFSLDNFAKAYDLLRGERKELYLGILLEYTREDVAVPRRVTLAPRRLDRERIKVGVFGAGHYATAYLLPAIKNHPLLELGGICTGSGITASQVAQRFGFDAAYGDVESILDGSDAILVATRHNDHADYAIKALQRGKPVFIEKPLVINTEQLEQVISAASSAGSVSIMVGFNRRFAPAIAAVKEHFAPVKGPRQILIRVNAGRIPADHWAHNPDVGGGRLIGEGCHFLDLALYLAGAPVRRVRAMGIPRPELRHALWDDFSIQLLMADGSLATVIYTALGNSGLAKERIEICGGGRSAIVDDYRFVDLWRDAKHTRKTWRKPDKGQVAEIDAWASGLMRGTSPIPFDEIINVHRACFAAIASLIGDGTAVEI
jgi:predicted dehydrogenase/threonine dehydrogenase-like Zn-dependent dehydrogenase